MGSSAFDFRREQARDRIQELFHVEEDPLAGAILASLAPAAAFAQSRRRRGRCGHGRGRRRASSAVLSVRLLAA